MIPPALVLETGSDWVSTIRFVNQLLRGGQRVLQVTGTLASGSPVRRTGPEAISSSRSRRLLTLDSSGRRTSTTCNAEADAAGVRLRRWDGDEWSSRRAVAAGWWSGSMEAVGRRSTRPPSWRPAASRCASSPTPKSGPGRWTRSTCWSCRAAASGPCTGKSSRWARRDAGPSPTGCDAAGATSAPAPGRTPVR